MGLGSFPSLSSLFLVIFRHFVFVFFPSQKFNKWFHYMTHHQKSYLFMPIQQKIIGQQKLVLLSGSGFEANPDEFSLKSKCRFSSAQYKVDMDQFPPNMLLSPICSPTSIKSYFSLFFFKAKIIEDSVIFKFYFTSDISSQLVRLYLGFFFFHVHILYMVNI